MKNYAMRFPGMLILLALIAACATSKYASVVSGVTSFGELRVTIGEGWLRAPASLIPEERSSSRTLTRENLEQDRLMIIPGVSDGEAIFRNQNEATPLPAFAANMNSEQIAAMVGQSMQQTLWNGNATVAIKNARDHGYHGIAGFAFDLDVNMPSGPDHKGVAGGFVYEDRLYVIVYSAESPEYFDRQFDVARELIDSATVRIKTIRMSALSSSQSGKALSFPAWLPNARLTRQRLRRNDTPCCRVARSETRSLFLSPTLTSPDLLRPG